MKLFSSALLAAAANAATLCTNVANLVSATCTSTGMVITVDETCRAAHYGWLNWGSTFVDGVITAVEMPGSPGAECLAVGSGAAWTYTFLLSQCNIAAAAGPSAADANGITWYTYTAYLNYDNAIAATLGTGNLQQLDQTKIECRVPANFQENALATAIAVVSTADLVPDESSDVNLWSSMQLDVMKGGTAATAGTWSAALATGGSIELGEHVKLEVSSATLTLGTDYNVAIKDCWASTVQNIRDAVPVGGAADNVDDDSGFLDFDATGTNVNGAAAAHETVKFYDDMCPKYNWVTSFADHSAITQSLSIELRQFMFNAAASGAFFYHCELSICLAGVDCVPDPTCAALTPANNAPTGRRRRAIVSSKRMVRNAEGGGDAGVDSGNLAVDASNCAETEEVDGVVICAKRAKSNARAAALSVLTGLFVCALH